MEKEPAHTISKESIRLANKAMHEYLKTGKITTVCPMCHQLPTITMTEHGERTTVSCPCRYVLNIEINL